MSTSGHLGLGSKLYSGAADAVAASITTEIAQVKNISGPDISVDDVDITTLDDSDGYRQFIPGLADAGEISVDLVYTKAQVTALYALVRTAAAFKVEFSDSGSTWHGNGYVKGLSNELEIGAEITGTMAIKCSSKWTFTAASA